MLKTKSDDISGRKFLERLERLRPIDDEFMRCIFRDNIPLAQMVLRILTGKPDLVVTRLETQKDFKRLAGARSVCLDAYCVDDQGKVYDIEVQRSRYGAGSHRARYHSSSMDIENLGEGESFESLPDTYTIFITEEDLYQYGKPFYEIERVLVNTGDYRSFEDGAHILYVNASYRDDSQFGRLMHDFCCSSPGEMKLPLMQEAARYYKETREGSETMSTVFEEILNEGIEKGREITQISNIKALQEKLNLSVVEAMDALKIPDSERKALMKLL